MSDDAAETKLLQPDIADHRDGVPAELVDAMFARVASETVDRKPSVRDRLRELATPARVGVALAGTLVVGLASAALLGFRDDLDVAGWLRFALTMGTVLLVWGVAGAVALRSHGRGGVGPLGWVVAIGALAIPVVLSVIPGVFQGVDVPMEAMGVHIGCLIGSGLITGLSAAVIGLFERSDRPAPWRLLAMGGAAGIVGFVFQGAHCPGVDPLHLLVGHATLGLVVGGILVGVFAILRRL